MGRLIILSRPGIQVVSGKVVKIGDADVTIENTCQFTEPTSLQETRTMILQSSADVISRLKLKLGSFIMATICPNDDTKTLADGLYSNVQYHARAYNIRYTGAFDFNSAGNQKESHVFCGAILDAKALDSGGTLVKVTWKAYGADEVKNLYTPIDITKALKNKAIFTCGRKKTTPNKKEFYTIKNLCNV